MPSPTKRSYHYACRALNLGGFSFLVSTYQAGKLIVVRAEGKEVNTHFRNFDTPMGLAFEGGRLAIGTMLQVWEFHNQPDVARSWNPPGRHDACFLPRAATSPATSGIHEIAWAGEELWFVNTRFSCLCTLDHEASFVPRWRPPFVSGLAADGPLPPQRPGHGGRQAEVRHRPGRDRRRRRLAGEQGHGRLPDRCGFAARSSRRGLSMPHSPRWYGGRLWVCESGAGTLGPRGPEHRPVRARSPLLPGFTRGLDFAGDLAFVGLSQVRESAVFSGIPITERLAAEERTCGVWVVDLRGGQTVASCEFEDGVQEIFAVQILPGIRYPDVLTEEKHARRQLDPAARRGVERSGAFNAVAKSRSEDPLEDGNGMWTMK